MKISRKGLHFTHAKGGRNAFFKDIIRFKRKRNIGFFITQTIKGIREELKP